MTIIKKYPSRTIYSGLSIQSSRWSAAHNPIIYEFQRKDYHVNSVVLHTTLFGVKLAKVILINSVITAPDTIASGDIIYLKSGPYDNYYEVDVVVNNYTFILKTTYIGNGSGGYMNLNSSRINFHYDMDILGVKANTYYVLGSNSFFPDVAGTSKVDISEWIKKLIAYKNEFDYSSLNKADKNASGWFNIRFVEKWEDNQGNSISSSTIIPNAKGFFVNAAQQLLSPFGQNMGEFCPFPLVQSEAKWLSGFEKPTYFAGYPFALGFIYSDNIAPYDVYVRKIERQQNGAAPGGTTSDLLSASEAMFVNRLRPEALGLNQNTKEIELWLSIDENSISTSQYATQYSQSYHQVNVVGVGDPNSPIE